MPGENQTLTRSFQETNRVAQWGLLQGAGLGLVLASPVAVALGFLGTWLDAATKEPEAGWVLTLVALTVGGFVGAVWKGQAELMRGWPQEFRARVWLEYRRGLLIFVPLGLPFALLLGWLCWRGTGLQSAALAFVLEVSLLFAGGGALWGYYRGERGVRTSLEQAGFFSAPLDLARSGRRGQDLPRSHPRGPRRFGGRSSWTASHSPRGVSPSSP